MEILDEDIAAVEQSIKVWREVTRGNPPPGVDWDDLTQESYLAILTDQGFDPKRGDRGRRVNALVRRVFLDACRDNTRNPFPLSEELSQEPYVLDPPVTVDAEDFLSSLTSEDREIVDRVRDSGLSGRNSALRRKETRTIQRLREEL